MVIRKITKAAIAFAVLALMVTWMMVVNGYFDFLFKSKVANNITTTTTTTTSPKIQPWIYTNKSVSPENRGQNKIVVDGIPEVIQYAKKSDMKQSVVISKLLDAVKTDKYALTAYINRFLKPTTPVKADDLVEKKDGKEFANEKAVQYVNDLQVELANFAKLRTAEKVEGYNSGINQATGQYVQNKSPKTYYEPSLILDHNGETVAIMRACANIVTPGKDNTPEGKTYEPPTPPVIPKLTPKSENAADYPHPEGISPKTDPKGEKEAAPINNRPGNVDNPGGKTPEPATKPKATKKTESPDTQVGDEVKPHEEVPPVIKAPGTITKPAPEITYPVTPPPVENPVIPDKPPIDNTPVNPPAPPPPGGPAD